MRSHIRTAIGKLWPSILTILAAALIAYGFHTTHQAVKTTHEAVTRIEQELVRSLHVHSLVEDASALDAFFGFLDALGEEFLASWGEIGEPETYFLPPLDHPYYKLPIARQLLMRREFASNLAEALGAPDLARVSMLPLQRREGIGLLLFDLVYPPLETQTHRIYDETLNSLIEAATSRGGDGQGEVQISKHDILIEATREGTDVVVRFSLSKKKGGSMTLSIETLRIQGIGLTAFADSLAGVFAVSVIRAFSESEVERVKRLLERRVEFVSLNDGYVDIGVCRCGVDSRSKGVVRATSEVSIRIDPSSDSPIVSSAKEGTIYYLINEDGDWLYLLDEISEGVGWGLRRDFDELRRGRWEKKASPRLNKRS